MDESVWIKKPIKNIFRRAMKNPVQYGLEPLYYAEIGAFERKKRTSPINGREPCASRKKANI